MRKTIPLYGEQQLSDETSRSASINQPHGMISGDPSRSACWLQPVHSSQTESIYRFRIPTGVVIGDSISQGNPESRGRLQVEGVPGFNPQHANVPGQLSYELGAITGFHWYNHGIGSQRTDEIWARWRRDVLAETVVLGDGRGSRTLDAKPYAVFIVAGINDVFQNRDDAHIQRYWIEMARSAKANGILAIFSNMGEHNAATPAWRDQIRRLNVWMADELPRYGATVVDFYEWSMDRKRGYGVHPGLFVDDVHPSRSGFQSLAHHYAAQWSGLPMYWQGLQLETVVDFVKPDDSYSRPRKLEIRLRCDYAAIPTNDLTLADCADVPINCISIPSDGRSNIVELRIREAFEVKTWSGFSKVRAIIGEQSGCCKKG
ncbi:SGNH/GDSL hydrolase family protein [Paenibacillus koleovorans]|uniref:SGNH/GDSL hydrolase family protein n=1 Tax=Paenibacillus koleovorans TaxID=121608 RepID=UPI000FDBEFA1|nr:GDSL-type esterase/lipase family protein [Paenibacillus koleovorans]